MMMMKMIMLLWAAVGFNVNFSVYAVACSLEGKKKKKKRSEKERQQPPWVL